jgi:hypothetical protein
MRNASNDLESLITLAGERFGDLSFAEAAVLRSSCGGEFVSCNPKELPPDDPINDPASAEGWGSERKVRADLVRWLCVDPKASELVDPHGLSVFGGAVLDNLDLSFIAVPFPIAFIRCWLLGDMNLVQMQIPSLSLEGSRTGPLMADRAILAGNLYLSRGFSAEGEVSLSRAQIKGILDCCGGQFKNSGGTALWLEGARLEGALLLEENFVAEGSVNLMGAYIGAGLRCNGGHFRNAGQTALLGDRAVVVGGVALGSATGSESITGFTARGEVRFFGASVKGEFDCHGGSFSNSQGAALQIVASQVEGDIFFCDGFDAEGEVRLERCEVGGNLDCGAGVFKCAGDKTAFCAIGTRVSGSVFLVEGFTAEGEVNLIGARIGGDLICRGCSFRNVGRIALRADRLSAAGAIVLSSTPGEQESHFLAQGRVQFSWAEAAHIDCRGGLFENIGGTALSLSGAKVLGDVSLGDTFKAEGEVDIGGAQIGGQLYCNGGWFTNPGKAALYAGGIHVTRNVYLGMGFVASGQVALFGAQIGGDLDCIGGSFRNKGGVAFALSAALIEGQVLLAAGGEESLFRAEGSVQLNGVRIDRDLVCSGGVFSAPGQDALSLIQGHIAGRVSLNSSFRADGGIVLAGAKVGGDFDCGSGIFSNTEALAINCEGLQVGGSIP